MPVLVRDIAPPLVVAQSQWKRLGITWTGYDGSLFDLTDIGSGIILGNGVKGMTMPPFDYYSTVLGQQPGASFQGVRVGSRLPYWPLFIYSDNSSDEFMARAKAILATMRPDQKGTWTVTTPATADAPAQSRFLDMRFMDDSDAALPFDPIVMGWNLYGFDFVADDNPLWYGPAIGQTFYPPDSTDVYMTSGGVLYLSKGGSVSTASITNPGNIDAWPVWTVTGPTDPATLSCGDGTIVSPAITSGQVWTFDTRPGNVGVFDQDGVDQTKNVPGWNPAPVPYGQDVPLAISLGTSTAAAKVSISLTPLYFRAADM